MSRFPFRIAPIAAALVTLQPLGAALAQGAPAATAAENLGTVVVTAQKREERLQEVPVAITLIDAATLGRSEGLTTANDITQLIPNAQASATDGRTRPRWFLRGIGTNETAASTVSPIGIYNDDVYLNNVYIQGFPLFDTERVEVLRGPQGTLWGKNTTGGAIHYVSRRPTFQTGGYARLTLGEDNERQVQGAFGGAIVDGKLAARVSLYDEHRDGWVDNTATGKRDGGADDQAARLQLLWLPSDDLDVQFQLKTRRLDGDKSPSFYVLNPAGTVKNPIYTGPLSRDTIAQAGEFSEKLDSDGASVRVNWTTALGTLSSITAYDTGKRVLNTGSPVALDISRSRALSDSRQTTQELRLASPKNASYDWIVGGYYFKESLFSSSVARRDKVAGASSTSTTGNSPQSFDITEYHQDTESQALFASGTWRFGGGLSLNGGVRRSSERKTYDLSYVAAPSTASFTGITQWWLPAGVSALGTPLVSHDDHTWKETTYDLTPAWQVNDHVNAYLRYAHGFRAGGFVVSSANTITQLEPETLNATELGVKTQWLGGKLTFNSAIFNYDYRDIIVGVLLPVPNSNPPTTQQVQENAAKGWSRGAEFELAWAPSRLARVGASLGLLKTRYTNYESTASGQSINATGNRFTRSPEVSVGLNGEYGLPLAGGAVAGLGGDISWRSKQYFNAVDQSNPTLEQGAYALANARVFYRSADNRLELTAFVRNLGNTLYSKLATSTATGVTREVYGQPRTIGASAQVRF